MLIDVAYKVNQHSKKASNYKGLQRFTNSPAEKEPGLELELLTTFIENLQMSKQSKSLSKLGLALFEVTNFIPVKPL